MRPVTPIALNRLRTIAALTTCALALAGCHAKELGSNPSLTRAAHVDPSWLTATRSCWPSLGDRSDANITDALADPKGFRGAFGVYAIYSDAELIRIASAHVNDAPNPDNNSLRNSSTPLLTRQQSLTGKATNAPDARDAQQVPPEALCAIHTGTPVGFR